MTKILIRISNGIDLFIDKVGRSISWLTTILMIIICIDVVLRYLFSNTKTWVIELEWHLFAMIFLIGASFTLLHDKHVRVDLFYEQFSESRQKIINSIGLLLFLVPWCLVIIYYGYEYAVNSFSFNEKSPQPGGLPARYIIKSFIMIGFSLLLLQAISELIKNLIKKEA